MGSKSAAKHQDFTTTQIIAERAMAIAKRRVWLPALVYECLPYFYITAGFAAVFATLYIAEWYWVVPYYLLLAALAIHAGIMVWRRRRSERRHEAEAGGGDDHAGD